MRKNGGYVPESECDKNKNFMCIFKKCNNCKYFNVYGEIPEDYIGEEV